MTAECLSAAPDQERHVCTLAAPIGVELIEDQKPQPLRGADQLSILRSGEQELEHHVVREEDVRRIAPNGFADVAFLLPRVPGEAHRRSTLRISLLEKLLQFLVLAVGQGVHRVHDDGLDATPGPVPEDVVHDRHDVRQALPGTRAAGQDVGLALLGL